MTEEESLRSFPLLPALGNPALERGALYTIYAPRRDNLKNRRLRWHRQMRVRIVFGVRHIEMSRVKGARRLHIEAVSAAILIRDGDGAPALWHVQQCRRRKGEYQARLKVDCGEVRDCEEARPGSDGRKLKARNRGVRRPMVVGDCDYEGRMLGHGGENRPNKKLFVADQHGHSLAANL